MDRSDKKPKSEVTCSFIMDRQLYYRYKSVLDKRLESVKSNLVKHMMNVIEEDELKQAEKRQRLAELGINIDKVDD